MVLRFYPRSNLREHCHGAAISFEAARMAFERQHPPIGAGAAIHIRSVTRAWILNVFFVPNLGIDAEGSAMQYSLWAFQGLILLALVNLAFYGACIGLLVKGLYGLSRKNSGDAVYIIIAVAPFLYYGYIYFSASGEQGRRAREVASWPRKPVTLETLPQILVVEGGYSAGLAKALVAAGPFKKAFAKDGFGPWYTYERRDEPDCPSRTPVTDWGADWNRPDHCTTVDKSTVSPELQQPYLHLLLDLKASYYRTQHTTGVVAGSVIELRWSKNAGGEIVAFYERPTFHLPVFPPLLRPDGFLRSEFMPGRHERSLNPYTFVLDAVGFVH
jgi:hypothetical protein